MNNENLEICKNCGGKCCLKSGCDYSPDDFESLSFNYLYHKLMEGNISIVSTLIFKRDHLKLIIDPFLLLRARCVDSKTIDLLSMKTKCSMLTSSGCKYTKEERPWGGLNLVPREDGKCYPEKDQQNEMLKWSYYQKMLAKLVEKISGNSVDEQLRLDVINLFEKVINRDYDNVPLEEVRNVMSLVPILTQIYPNEAKKTVIKNKIKTLK